MSRFFVGIVYGSMFLYGIGRFIWQCYSYLRYGEWPLWTLGSDLVSFAARWNMPNLAQSVTEPQSWFGLVHLVNTIPGGFSYGLILPILFTPIAILLCADE